MDLLPVRQAAKLRRTRNNLEINCDELNLSDLGPQCPVSPVTPRTPKSLISQLSRDDSSVPSRKRLSYSMSMDRDSVTIESASESSESDSDDTEEQASAKPKDLNLLSIDITSLLGKRVRRHVHIETPVEVLENSESYCRTPVKNTFLEKLRKKPPSYPITYKPRRIANLHKQNHLYRFFKRERKEFYEHMSSGLSKESRDKLKNMKELRIILPKLTKEEMLQWVPRRVLQRQLFGDHAIKVKAGYQKFLPVYGSYPSGPMLLSKNVDKLLGLKKKSASQNRERMQNPLTVGNYISEEMDAELSKLKLTLYRSLLYEVEEYKAGKLSDLVVEKQNSLVKTGCTFSTQNQSVKHKKLSPKRDYVPIADRVFKTEKEDKPKGGMSVLRALLRKNKEITALPEQSQASTAVTSASKMKLTHLQGVSKTLKADIMRGLKVNQSSNDTSSVSSSCLSSPGSVHSSDENDAAQVKVVNKTPPLDDSVSIISMSSDGESPTLNCCAGCNMKAENDRSKIQIPSDKDLSNFLEPLTVNVDSEFHVSKNQPDLQIDTTYGVPSPVPSTTESPLPLTPLKKTVKLKEEVQKIMDEEAETTTRYTRSSVGVILPTFDELTDILKIAETSKRENKLSKLVSEEEEDGWSEKEKLGKSSSEKAETPMKLQTKSSQLRVQGVQSPRSSPKKEDKLSRLDRASSERYKPLAEKEGSLPNARDQKKEVERSSPKIESSLIHALNGTYWSETKSRRKDIKRRESSIKASSSLMITEKVLQAIPVKKSFSLTPSPSPKKSDIGKLERSFTDTPKSSPKKVEEHGDSKMSNLSGNGSLSPTKDSDTEKTVIQLRSSTLLSPTKMTIRTRSVSVDSSGKLDDNQYSLRSGNFVIDSPRKTCNPPRKSVSDLDVNSPKVQSAKKESKTSLESSAKTGCNTDISPSKHNSVQDVSRKIEFTMKANLNVVQTSSPKRPKRKVSMSSEEMKPSKLRKVSSDVGVKSKN